MDRKYFRVGSIAVLFAVVVLCMAIFGTLTVVTSLSDSRVAQRYGDHVQNVYHCQMLAERWLAQADGYLAGNCTLPEDTWTEGDELGTRIEDGPMKLTVRIRQTESGYEILQWYCSTLWEPENEWNLWY